MVGEQRVGHNRVEHDDEATQAGQAEEAQPGVGGAVVVVVVVCCGGWGDGGAVRGKMGVRGCGCPARHGQPHVPRIPADDWFPVLLARRLPIVLVVIVDGCL